MQEKLTDIYCVMHLVARPARRIGEANAQR